MIKPETVLKRSRKFRFQWEESQQKYVLLYAEGMVQLNESAAEILQLCDGQHSVQHILDSLRVKFNDENLQTDVLIFLRQALAKGWVVVE